MNVKHPQSIESQKPKSENSNINFKRVSICLEILIDDDYLDENYLNNKLSQNGETGYLEPDDNYFIYEQEQLVNTNDKAIIAKEFYKKYGYCLKTHSYET